MTMKAIIFGTEEAFEKFNPYYDEAVKRGDFEIVARILFDPKTNSYVYNDNNKLHGGGG